LKLKYTLVLLVLLIFLPAILYLVYEINTLADTESMINEIYTEQQNTMLFSVNQYSWDISNFWTTNLEKIIIPGRISAREKIVDYMNRVSGLQAVIISDTLLSKYLLINKDNSQIPSETVILDELQSGIAKIEQLTHRKRVGYSNIESIVIQSADSLNRTLVLLSIAKIEPNEFVLIGMLVNA